MITKPLFNGAVRSPGLDQAQNSRATLVPRGVIPCGCAADGARHALCPSSLHEAGVRRPIFPNSGASTAVIVLRAGRSANRPAAFQRDAPNEAISPSSRMNSNLVETRNKQPHLQSITTLAFALRG